MQASTVGPGVLIWYAIVKQEVLIIVRYIIKRYECQFIYLVNLKLPKLSRAYLYLV